MKWRGCPSRASCRDPQDTRILCASRCPSSNPRLLQTGSPSRDSKVSGSISFHDCSVTVELHFHLTSKLRTLVGESTVQVNQSIIGPVQTKRVLLTSARNLDLYQVLAPNAYSYKEEFIPVIRKTVQSQVHEVSEINTHKHARACTLLQS